MIAESQIPTSDGPGGGRLRRAELLGRHGRVNNLIGLIIEATGLVAEVGEVCKISAGRDRPPVSAEVVGFREGRTLLMPLGELQGIGPGTKVQGTGAPFRVAAGSHLLGHVLDGLGRPLQDDLGAGEQCTRRSITVPRSSIAAPPDPLSRPRITQRVALGVRAIDSLTPCGRGQRLGIFAGSGVGKSTLLAMIARGTDADVNVIALVGERGREVREFIEHDLGEALARSVVVVATSDEPALVRIKAAFTATTIAEHFRDQGHDVMLMMDSVTRFAMAQREVGLAIGEPPATRGYTPSVFALLPRLLERAGTSGGLHHRPLHRARRRRRHERADRRRGALDPRRPHRAHARACPRRALPGIDVLQSVSRLTGEIVAPEIAAAGQRLRAALAALREKEDLISIGAYHSGSDPLLDAALEHRPRIDAFLRQAVTEPSRPADSDRTLLDLSASLERSLAKRSGEILDAEEVLPGRRRRARRRACGGRPARGGWRPPI